VNRLRPGAGRLLTVAALLAAGRIGWGAAVVPAYAPSPKAHSAPHLVAVAARRHPVVHSLGLTSRGGAGRDPYRAVYQTAGARYGVPWRLLAAQGWVESRWNPKDVRINGPGMWDIGIAQADTRWHPKGAWPSYGHPRFGIMWAARKLAQYHRQYGSWRAALERYHDGPNRAAWRWGYAARVLAAEAVRR
jgi:soluble lytic murein transglycosylase-like protein